MRAAMIARLGIAREAIQDHLRMIGRRRLSDHAIRLLDRAQLSESFDPLRRFRCKTLGHPAECLTWASESGRFMVSGSGEWPYEPPHIYAYGPGKNVLMANWVLRCTNCHEEIKAPLGKKFTTPTVPRI